MRSILFEGGIEPCSRPSKNHHKAHQSNEAFSPSNLSIDHKVNAHDQVNDPAYNFDTHVQNSKVLCEPRLLHSQEGEPKAESHKGQSDQDSRDSGQGLTPIYNTSLYMKTSPDHLTLKGLGNQPHKEDQAETETIEVGLEDSMIHGPFTAQTLIMGKEQMPLISTQGSVNT